MAKNIEKEVIEMDELEEATVEVDVIEKKSLIETVKDGAAKIIHSKPAKVIGGIGLVALGAIGAMKWSSRTDGSCDDDDLALPDNGDISVTEF